MRKRARNLAALLGGRLVLIGVGLGGLFWIIESALHILFFRHSGFVEQILSPEAHEAWMRLIVVGLFFLFGIYAQWLVDERRRARDGLRLANAELTQIFETSADGMRVIDPAFNVLRANQTFCALAGQTKQEAVGKKCHEGFRGPLCHSDGCPMTRILGGEDRVECDVEKVRQDGSPVPCIVTATPFRDAQGRIVGIVEDFKDISERKRTEEQLRRSQSRLRELTAYLESAREKERTRVAREIHDELGQSLTALKLDVHWLAHRLPLDPPVLLRKAEDMQDLIDRNIEFVQRVCSELRPGLLDNLGLSAAMEWQSNEFQGRTGIECDLQACPEEVVLDQARSTALFRVFQETLTNVLRHAGATRVRIRLEDRSEAIVLEVSDDGKGITPEEVSDPRSFGLMGIRERVHAFGGNLDIDGRPGQGTTVRVTLPAETRKPADDPNSRGG